MGKAIIINGINASSIGIGQVTFDTQKYWVQGLGNNLQTLTTEWGFSYSYRIFYGSSYGRGANYFAGKTIDKVNCVNGGTNSLTLTIGECDTDGTNPTPLTSISNVASGFNSISLQSPITIGTGKTLYFQWNINGRAIDSLADSVPVSPDVKGVDIINISSGDVTNYPNSTSAVDFEISE